MRGRVGWWRRLQKPGGVFEVMPPDFKPARDRTSRGINRDVLDTPEQIAEEKRRRLESVLFVEEKIRGTKNRADVLAREQRILKIAKELEARGWEGRPNTWIALRLSKASGESVNTLRADIAEAKKYLMGNHPTKN